MLERPALLIFKTRIMLSQEPNYSVLLVLRQTGVATGLWVGGMVCGAERVVEVHLRTRVIKSMF